MRKLCSLNLLISCFILLFSCGDKSSKNFPVEKMYWTPEDYETANEELTSLKYNNKELPNFDNPKTDPIFRKIVDTTNFSVVANDPNLGLQHRKEFLSKMFDQFRQIVEAYTGTDRSDKYQYPLELIEIEKFGLALEVPYIEIGNQEIVKNADNPNAADVVDIVRRNKNIIINNYNLYLEFVNREDRLNEKALNSYGEGLKDFFPKLIINIAPDGDYSEMQVKVDNMLKKSKNQQIIAALQNIQTLIKAKTVNSQ